MSGNLPVDMRTPPLTNNIMFGVSPSSLPNRSACRRTSGCTSPAPPCGACRRTSGCAARVPTRRAAPRCGVRKGALGGGRQAGSSPAETAPRHRDPRPRRRRGGRPRRPRPLFCKGIANISISCSVVLFVSLCVLYVWLFSRLYFVAPTKASCGCAVGGCLYVLHRGLPCREGLLTTDNNTNINNNNNNNNNYDYA